MKKRNLSNSLIVDARMINSSGIGVYLKNILPQIAKEFNLILLGNKKELALFEWTKELQIIEFKPKIYSLKEQLLYPFIIPRTNLFWCPHFNVPLLPIKAKQILTTIYDVNHLANRNKSSLIKWGFAKVLYSNAVRRSTKIITISNFSKSELLRFTHVKDRKIRMIYCGVDYDFFAYKKETTIEEIPRSYILYVGNIKPHKNLIILLRAYSVLPNSIKKKHKLVILGKKDGFITPDLEIFKFIEMNNLMNDIFFTGYVKDEEVPAIYQKARLFVFPSLYEGFGLPVLEAMASGIPVLTSDATSLPEVGSDAAIYFNPKDHFELAEKIQTFLSDDDLRENYVAKGKQQAKLFSWDTAAQRHITTIKELIK